MESGDKWIGELAKDEWMGLLVPGKNIDHQTEQMRS